MYKENCKHIVPLLQEYWSTCPYTGQPVPDADLIGFDCEIKEINCNGCNDYEEMKHEASTCDAPF